MPSIPDEAGMAMEPGENYHDLADRYPDAPVSRGTGDAIVHRVSDGDLVIVEMSRMLSRELELQTAVEKLRGFVEDDLCGEVVRLGDSRLLLLPSDFESTRKSEGTSMYF